MVNEHGVDSFYLKPGRKIDTTEQSDGVILEHGTYPNPYFVRFESEVSPRWISFECIIKVYGVIKKNKGL
jgi:hypothetical protein